MEGLWKEALAEIEVEVSKPIFLAFFKPTSLLDVSDSIATIASPTNITTKYIEKKYYGLIKRALDKKTGENLDLVFITSESRPQVSPKLPSLGGMTPLFTPETNQTRQRPRRLRTDYVFESMAVSEGNQLAYTASVTVATNPGIKYNPLFLYGTVGVGKTHLLNAVGNKLFDSDPGLNILYLTTEEFTNEVVEAIKDRTTTQMRKKFRNTDVLLLDDVQFLAGKDHVQQELFHTFNSLVDKGKQVVLSSDRPPEELTKIEPRLASRFSGGLTLDIEPPDFELRSAILLIKAKKYGVFLTLDAAKAVAERIEDTRALEGFLLRIVSSGVTGEKIAPEDIDTLLKKTEKKTSPFYPENIIQAVCSFYGIKPTQLRGSGREQRVVIPRHVCMFLLKERGLTFSEIGNLLGGRDHTTVIHGVEKIEKQLVSSPQVSGDILSIKRALRQNSLE